jgi:response regulator NasT
MSPDRHYARKFLTLAHCMSVLPSLSPADDGKTGGLRHRAFPGYTGNMLAADLSILVIDDNRLRAAIIEEGLREAGYTRVSVIHSVEEVARKVADIAPDVVVIDLENPRRDQLEGFFSLSKALRKPVAMFVDRSDASEIEAAVEAGVSAYVVDGLKKERVKPILEMAISRFNAFSRLTRELEDARSALEDRKIIDQAKALLMKSRNIGESEAYALLRSTAMNQNRKIVDIAQGLITASGLLKP